MMKIKSNNKLENFNPNRIVNKLRRLAKAANLNYVETDKLSQTVIQGLYDGISTDQIDDYSAIISANNNRRHPEYSKLAAVILVDRLQKNSISFKELTNKLYQEGRLNKDYYNKVAQYADLIKIDTSRDYNIDYFGFRTLQKGYLLSIEDKDTNKTIVETPQQMYLRVAIAMGKNVQEIQRFYDSLSKDYMNPASPLLFNSGTTKQSMISCNLVTLLEGNDLGGTNTANYAEPDSLEGLKHTEAVICKLSAGAAGLGLNLSPVRSKESIISTTGGKAAGLLRQLKIYNELALTYNQSGKRQGSFAIYVEPWHKDVFDFLKAGRPHTSEAFKAVDLFYALWIPDLFMEKLEQAISSKEEVIWYLMCPNDIKKAGVKDLSNCYGKEFVDNYNKAIDLGLGTPVDILELAKEIAITISESGTPYILFKDAVNRSSMQNNIGVIKSSNLCVAPETLLLTDAGYIPIGELKDQEVTIWNGFEWSDVTVRKTGSDKQLYEVGLDNGNFVICTDYHKWILKDKVERIPTIELQEGDVLKSYKSEQDWKQIHNTVISVTKLDRKDDVYCLTEPKRNSMVVNGVMTGNCAEITLYTDEKTVANCVISSINVLKILDSNNNLDEKLIEEVTEDLVYLLNRLIDVNHYVVKESIEGAKQRALGIGIAGLADVFHKKRIAFDSEEAYEFSHKLSELLYYYSLKASCKFAKEEGTVYEFFEGSPYSKGELHPDLYFNNTDFKSYIGKDKWEELRDMVKEGVANSTLMAYMPTASSASIKGVNECFEPFTENAYLRKTLGGEFLIVNKWLVNELLEKGLYSEDLMSSILLNKGSVQHINSLPQELKDRYKTAWEISGKAVMEHASRRTPFICQTQSMNIYIKDATVSRVVSAMVYGWSKGLKTGSYYVHSRESSQAKMVLSSTESISKGKNPDISCVGCEA